MVDVGGRVLMATISSHDRIKRIFEVELSNFAEENNLPISYFNVKFTPVVGETYLRSYLTPTVTDSFSLSGDHKLLMGIYQISIITKVGVGTSIAAELASKLGEIFTLNRRYSGDGWEVQQITHLQVSKGFNDETVYILPTSFTYRCDTN